MDNVRRLAPYLTVALFAAWPYVNFAHTNFGETYSYGRLALIALVTIAAALVLFEVLRRWRFVGGREAAAVIVSLLVVVFFSYALIGSLAHFLFDQYQLRTWAVVALLTPFVALAVSRSNAVRAVAPVVGAILIAVPLLQIVAGLTGAGGARSAVAPEQVATGPIIRRHSVYLFVHDGYPRDDVLRQLGYDNEPFLGELERRGFYVDREAHSNYDSTNRMLTSAFFRQPIIAPDGTPMPSAQQTALAKRAETGDNPVHEFFVGNGYSTAIFSSSARNCNPRVSLCATKWLGSFGMGQLEANLLKMTPLLPIAGRLSFPNEFTYTVDIQGFMGQLQALPQPVFVLAHILDAHPPFSYTSTCEQSFEGKDDFYNYFFGTDFYDALRCSNRNLIEILDRIRERDPEGIIIVAADHGPSFNRWLNLEAHQLDIPGVREALFERYTTLGAWKLPESCRRHLRPAMTPINIFPIVEACLTGTEPRLLPDQAWYLEDGGDRIYLEGPKERWLPVPISLGRDAYDVGKALREARLLPASAR